jgi:DNA transformation protein
MAKPTPFVTRVLGLLLPLGPVEARSMFGAFGLFLDERMFGLIDRDRLYFKVDDASVGAFRAAGGEAFSYTTSTAGRVVMAYWSPPEAALADGEALLPWAGLGVAAAARAKAGRIRKRAARAS